MLLSIKTNALQITPIANPFELVDGNKVHIKNPLIVNNILDKSAENKEGIYQLSQTKHGLFKKNDTAANEERLEKKKDNAVLQTTRETTRDNGDKLGVNQALEDVEINDVRVYNPGR